MEISEGDKMKSVIIFLLLISNINYSQNNTMAEELFKIDKNTIYEKANSSTAHYLKCDFSIEKTNLYITNKDELTIIKFDKTGRKIFTKNLMHNLRSRKIDNITNYPSFDANTETDASGNIYCLITSNEYFLDFLKYDSNGVFQEKFTLKGSNPSNRITSYYINHPTSEIIFNTMPVDITNPKNFNVGKIFIYNLKGEFLRKSKYYIHDSDNNLYKADYKNDGFEVIKIYDGLKETKKMKIPYENIVKEKWQRSNSDNWYFVGVGKNESFYYANNDRIAKFNFNKNTIKYIKIKNIIGNNLYTSSQNIKTTPKGELVIKAFSENVFGYASKKEPKKIKIDKNEVDFTFFKIN